MNKCSRCGTEFEGNYCNHCGKAAQMKKIDAKYLFSEISSVFFLEKGVFFTIKELLLRPGKSVSEFLEKDRHRLVKPVIFIIVTSLLYSLSLHFFQFDDGYITISDVEDEPGLAKTFNWIQSNYGYTNIIVSLFVAFILVLLFRKSKINYFENLVLLMFYFGMMMLFFAISEPISTFFNSSIVMDIAVNLSIIYVIWAIGRFYGGGWKSYLKAFFSFFLGYGLFLLFIFVLALLIQKVGG